MSNAVAILSLIIDGMQTVNQLSASLTTIAQIKAKAEAEGRDVSSAELEGARALVDVSTMKLKALLNT
jgi:hypothetical protein